VPELNFKIDGAEPVPHAAAPTLAFKLLIEQPGGADSPALAIENVLLRCQVRLEPARRRYTPGEQARLFEIFGEPQRWAQTLKSMLWTNASVLVPPFTNRTTVDLQVPFTFDFNIATTKYFDALEDGQIPLCFLFSGTIFYSDQVGALQVAQISWEKEADYKLPVQVWKQTVEQFFPGSAWVMLRKDLFDELVRFKLNNRLMTLDHAMEMLFQRAQSAETEPANPRLAHSVG
jgi:Family of unknown function (DUF6084)